MLRPGTDPKFRKFTDAEHDLAAAALPLSTTNRLQIDTQLLSGMEHGGT